MRLTELFAGLVPVTQDATIDSLTSDSRLVKPRALFFAYPGEHVDGRNYIHAAIQKGASAICYQLGSKALVQAQYPSVPLLAVENIESLMHKVAARFYRHPSKHLRMIGVTGTNGKTSCTQFLAQALNQLQMKTAMIGTLGYGFFPALVETGFTTPQALELQNYLAKLKKSGAQAVTMEVSSHALAQRRVQGVAFDIAVLTQLSQDHLDYHKTMAAYAAAKAKLFAFESIKAMVLNADDVFGLQLAQTYAQSAKTVLTYSLKKATADVVVTKIKRIKTGFAIRVATPWGAGDFILPLLGEFNISNVLAVLSVLGYMGYDMAMITAALEQLTPVCGRMQLITELGKPSVVVDYAHTPDALEKALQALTVHCRGRLFCVFGCGGNRDQDKRAKMGRVAEQYADHVIITNDNPRQEDPAQIAQQIAQGFVRPQAAEILLDRAQAISQAVQFANRDDIVLIAGKGHEQYQIIGQQKRPFSDQTIVQTQLKIWPSPKRKTECS